MSSYWEPFPGTICLGDGTAAAPSLPFCNETGTGIFRVGAGQWSIAILGVERVRVGQTETIFVGNVEPGADAAFDLGNASFRWRDAYLSSSARLGANPATIGSIRGANGAYWYDRNAANTADGLVAGAGSAVEIGDATFPAVVMSPVAGGNLRIGATVASADLIRVPNATYHTARNAANTANHRLIGLTGSDQAEVGPSVAVMFPGNALGIGTTPVASGSIRGPSGGDITINHGTNRDIIIQDNGTEYARFLGNTRAVRFGVSPWAGTGVVRLPTTVNDMIKGRNQANTADLNMLGGVTSSDRIVVGDAGNELRLEASAGNVDFRYAVTALGGGVAPALGTIGGAGPAAAAQNSWLRILINGTASFIPIWR